MRFFLAFISVFFLGQTVWSMTAGDIEAEAEWYLNNSPHSFHPLHHLMESRVIQGEAGVRLFEIVEHRLMTTTYNTAGLSRLTSVLLVAQSLMSGAILNEVQKKRLYDSLTVLLLRFSESGGLNDILVQTFKSQRLWSPAQVWYVQQKLSRVRDTYGSLESLIEILKTLESNKQKEILMSIPHREGNLFLPYVLLQFEFNHFDPQRWTYFLRMLEDYFHPNSKRPPYSKGSANIQFDKIAIRALQKIQILYDEQNPELLKALKARRRKATSSEEIAFYDLLFQRKFAVHLEVSKMFEASGSSDPLNLTDPRVKMCVEIFVLP